MTSHSPPGRFPPHAALLLAALLVACAGAVSAPETEAPPEHTEVVQISEDCHDCNIELTEAWRYHPGDDPAWADPGFDDSGWGLAATALREPDEVPGGWPGLGWFRRRILVTEGFGDAPLGMWMTQAGASEIYVDGRLMTRFGTVAAEAEQERPVNPQVVSALRLAPGVEHLLAVRFSNRTGHVYPGGFRGFRITLGEMQSLTGEGLRLLRTYPAALGAAVGLFAAFALLHFLLFAFRPQAAENLLFALFTGSMVGMLLCEVPTNFTEELARAVVWYKLALTFGVAMALGAVLLVGHLFRRRPGPVFAVLAVAAAGLLAWVWTRPAFFELLPWLIFVALAYLETVRRTATAILRREPDAWVIGAGFLAFTLAVLTSLADALGLPAPPEGLGSIIGIGILVLSFSIFLTRRVARTNRELAQRLVQVEELTARTIEQERRAAQEEAERRVLEADNRRKTRELEEARRLQLALLPREVPRLEHFEVAVHMTTANEVGGDYYDFLQDGDGCTLAVGDATGHGLQAGMVVAVAKSLFHTSCAGASLPAVLERIGEGLASMHQRVASMALLLVHLNGHRLRLASAGMPPVLVWHRAAGEVEEVLLPGVPLGTLRGTRFDEREVEVGRGDTVLMMTDGFAEVTSPDGEQLGYERAERYFAAVAHLPPEGIIESLTARVSDFHAGAALPDDLTLVALRARG